MSVFTESELAFLQKAGLLGRLATVGPDGMPHIAPVGWRLAAEGDVIEIGGFDLTKTKKFRDISRTGRAAFVVDEVLPPWQPRGIEIRGRAEAVAEPSPVIRIHPHRIIGWGLDGNGHQRNARTVSEAPDQA